MPYTNKRFEELDVLDDFLISAIAAVPEIGEAFCRRILSVLLQREIGKIKVTAQHALPALSLPTGVSAWMWRSRSSEPEQSRR